MGHLLKISRLKALCTDQQGSVMTLVAVGMTVIGGFAALAVDASYFYGTQRQLLGAADAAALAAISQLPDEDDARAVAREYAEKNMPQSQHGRVLSDSDLIFGHWDFESRTFTPGAKPTDAIQVTVRRAAANGNPAETYFAALLGYESMDITATSIAIVPSSSFCVLALNSSVRETFKVNMGDLETDGCGIQVNSSSRAALSVSRNGSLEVPAPGIICIHGEYAEAETVSPTPDTDCDPVPDPLAGLAAPDDSLCDHTELVELTEGDHSLSPGVYCAGINTTHAREVTFEPGLYVIKGKLKTSGQILRGDGVTFYMSDEVGVEVDEFGNVINAHSVVDISGQNEIHFKAPSSGPTAGILFYGDRNAASNWQHLIGGRGALWLEGTLYFPANTLRINGADVTTVAPFTNLIVDSFKFSGDGSMMIKSEYGRSTIPLPAGLGGSAARLVM